MHFKVGDKVRLHPQDDQWVWKDAKGRSLTDGIGEIVRDHIEYDAANNTKHIPVQGYGVCFINRTSNDGKPYIIEGHHLIKIDDDEWLEAQPNLKSEWNDSDVWTPYKKSVKAA